MLLFFRKRKPSDEARKRLEYQMCLVSCPEEQGHGKVSSCQDPEANESRQEKKLAKTLE